MSRNHLGEFEEIVMLTIAVLNNHAYGVAIIDEIEQRLGRSVSIGSIQIVLKRLEKKGYLKSTFGEATAMRGGKRKRFYSVTDLGKSMLKLTQEQRSKLWQAIPGVEGLNIKS